MRGGALSTFASLAIVVALAGCSGSSWQFWKGSAASRTPADPTLAGTPPAEAVTPSAPTATPVTTATPPPATDTPVAHAPAANGFTALPMLSEVRFRSGQVTLARVDAKALDGVVRWLQGHPGAEVLIEGHTDDLGTSRGNLVVGEKRATAIMQYLVSKGVEPSRISIVSVGSDQPRCVEKTEACRAKNRRARLLVKQP